MATVQLKSVFARANYASVRWQGARAKDDGSLPECAAGSHCVRGDQPA